MATKVDSIMIELMSLCLLLNVATAIPVEEVGIGYDKIFATEGIPLDAEETYELLSHLKESYNYLSVASQDEFKDKDDKLTLLNNIWYDPALKICAPSALRDWYQLYSSFGQYIHIKHALDVMVVPLYDNCRDKFQSFLGPISEQTRKTNFWSKLNTMVYQSVGKVIYALVSNLEQITKGEFVKLLESKDPEILGYGRYGLVTEASQAIVDRLVQDVAGMFIPGHCEFLKTVRGYAKLWPGNYLGLINDQESALDRLAVYCAIKDYKV